MAQYPVRPRKRVGENRWIIPGPPVPPRPTQDSPSPRAEDCAANGVSAQQAIAAAMLTEARQRGLALTGPNRLLQLFTNNVPETALKEETTEHLGHEKNRAPGWS